MRDKIPEIIGKDVLPATPVTLFWVPDSTGADFNKHDPF
jgi:hypothetical protein